MATASGSAQTNLSAILKVKNTAGSLFSKSINDAQAISFGTTSGKFDTLIYGDRILAASATETLNLLDGSLLDVFGVAAPLQNVKLVTIYQIANADGATDASSFTIGNAGANFLQLNFGSGTDTWSVYKGGAPFKAGRPAGFTVDGTHRLLKVANADGTNKGTYRLIISGVHT